MEKNKRYEGVVRGSSAGLDEEFTLGLSEEPAGGRREPLIQYLEAAHSRQRKQQVQRP